MEYEYPIDLDWSNDEMMTVVSFFNAVEAFYENKVQRDTILERYQQFKNIVPGKAEEKQIFKSFEQSSGYSSYHAVKHAQTATDTQFVSNNTK